MLEIPSAMSGHGKKELQEISLNAIPLIAVILEFEGKKRMPKFEATRPGQPDEEAFFEGQSLSDPLGSHAEQKTGP